MKGTTLKGNGRRSGLLARDLAMLLDLAPERWMGALVQLNHLPHYGHRLNVIVLAHDLAEMRSERDRENAVEPAMSDSSARSTVSSKKIVQGTKA